MHELIRWYKDSPLRLRVVFRTDSRVASRHPGRHWAADAERPDISTRRRILVVCFANACRSPAAAEFLRVRLDRSRWKVVSAGTNAVAGEPAVHLMQAAALEHGLDLSDHRGSGLTAADIRAAEWVIAMSQAQVDKLIAIEPRARRRIRLLGGFSPSPNTWGLSADPGQHAANSHEIPDPSGGNLETHRQCCDRLAVACDRLAHWIEQRDVPRPLPARRPPASGPPTHLARLV